MDAAVVQLVRIPACHAGGRGFKSRPPRHFICGRLAQLVERYPYKVDATGSSPVVPTITTNSANNPNHLFQLHANSKLNTPARYLIHILVLEE
jgi:hypothetical protein